MSHLSAGEGELDAEEVVEVAVGLEGHSGGYDEHVVALGGGLDEGVEFGQDVGVAFFIGEVDARKQQHHLSRFISANDAFCLGERVGVAGVVDGDEAFHAGHLGDAFGEAFLAALNGADDEHFVADLQVFVFGGVASAVDEVGDAGDEGVESGEAGS